MAALSCALVTIVAFVSRSGSASRQQGRIPAYDGGLACCSLLGPSVAASAAGDNSHKQELLRCVNGTAGAAARPEVVVVTQVVGAGVTRYAAAATLVNAIWAERHGYSFRVAGVAPEQPSAYDSRYGKVALLRSVVDELLSQEPSRRHAAVGGAVAQRWVVWMDADAVVVHTAWSVDAVTSAYAAEDTHIVVCAEANMETNTRMNSGTMLLRVHPWTSAFLRAWWAHPDAGIGAPDQWTFDMLWDADAVEVRRHTRIVPATAFNSEPPFYATWTSGVSQPVIHLMGDADSVRASVFGHLAASLCAHSGGLPSLQGAPPTLPWPPTRDMLVRLMYEQYSRDIEDASQPVLMRAHAAERLGMLMGHAGRDAERAKLVARTLAWRESVYGRDSPQMAHDVQVLANLLSVLGRHAEAEPLALRALHLAQRSLDPKGRPQRQLVAAAHGDLGSLYGRMGDRARALHHLHECLSVEESIWGADNPHSADTHYNIALTLQLSGELGGAKTHFEQALELYIKHLGRSHPSVDRATTRLKELGRGHTSHVDAPS